jgi:hypothetical protein
MAEGGVEQMQISSNLKELGKKLMLGMGVKKGLISTQALGSSVGSIGKRLFGNATFALKNMQRHIPQCQTSAQIHVNQSSGAGTGKTLRSELVLFVKKYLNEINILKQERVVKIVRISCKAEPKAVYDLTVEIDHCYYANGLLVSNSDAFRYLGVGALQVEISAKFGYTEGQHVHNYDPYQEGARA